MRDYAIFRKAPREACSLEEHLAIEKMPRLPRRQPVAFVRARILLLIAALASLDWRTIVLALVAAMASWGRAGRFQQGAVIGTVIFMAIPGVFVFNGMVFVARHDTSSWISGMITVLLRHGGLSFLLAGWAFFSL